MSKLSREEVAKKVREILIDKLSLAASELESEDLKLSSDLGADSLDAVELVMEFEKEFEIAISDERAEKISTVKDCIDTVHGILNAL